MSEFKTALDVAVTNCPISLPISRAHKCEFTLNIGIFHDGTDNNKGRQEAPSANTNVARLSEAYRNYPQEGFFRHYISGVGTPFLEIGEAAAPVMGSPFGVGGEARIVYGLLQVINSVHRFVNNINDKDGRFNKDQLAALCSDTRIPDPNVDSPQPRGLTPQQQILQSLGLSGGLIGARAEDERRRFFGRVVTELTQQVQSRATLPKISAIYLDVFGFSRGRRCRRGRAAVAAIRGDVA